MNRVGWYLLVLVCLLAPTEGMSQAMSPNPFYGGVARLGVWCRIQDSSNKSGESGIILDRPTAEKVGQTMVTLLAAALATSPVAVERLPENSDAVADPATLVILLHGRILSQNPPATAGTGRLLVLSLAMYRNHPTDGGRSLFPAAPVAIPLAALADWGTPGNPSLPALQQALTEMITVAGLQMVSSF